MSRKNDPHIGHAPDDIDEALSWLNHMAHGEPEMHLDHICRNRRCVNTAHLREATPYENAQNGARRLATSCKHGHPWDDANTYRWHGIRKCRACNRRNVAAGKARRQKG